MAAAQTSTSTGANGAPLQPLNGTASESESVSVATATATTTAPAPAPAAEPVPIVPPSERFFDSVSEDIPPGSLASRKSVPAAAAATATATATATAPAPEPESKSPTAAAASANGKHKSQTAPPLHHSDSGGVMRPDGSTVGATVTNGKPPTAPAPATPSKKRGSSGGDGSAAAFKGSVVPWKPDSYSAVCMLCKTAFGIFTRIHHCRLCGRLVCGTCSAYKIVIPLGVGPNGGGEQRACKPCRLSLTDYVKKLNALIAVGANGTVSGTNSAANSRNNSAPATPNLSRVVNGAAAPPTQSAFPIPPTPISVSQSLAPTPSSATHAAGTGSTGSTGSTGTGTARMWNGKNSPAPPLSASALLLGSTSGAGLARVASNSSIASLTALPPVVTPMILPAANNSNSNGNSNAAAAAAAATANGSHPTVVTTCLEKANEKPIAVLRSGSTVSSIASPAGSALNTPLTSPTPIAASQALVALVSAGLISPTSAGSGEQKRDGSTTSKSSTGSGGSGSGSGSGGGATASTPSAANGSAPVYVVSPRPQSVSGLLLEGGVNGIAHPPNVVVWLRTIELVGSGYDGARLTLRYWLWRGYPVPPIVRPILWLTLTDALHYKRRAGSADGPHSYYTLCSKPPTTEAIRRDVPRSAPNETFLKYFGIPCEVGSKEKFEQYLSERPTQRALYRILTAYSNYESRKVDYCQGMNYLASLLLLVLHDEEMAFWTLVSVLASPKHAVSDMFLSDQPHLKTRLSAFDRHFNSRLPALHQYLAHSNVLTDSYAVEWFTTVFIYSVSYRTTVRIWDLFLLDGTEVLDVTALAILECVAPTLTAHNEPDTVLPLLRKCVPQLTSSMIFERVIEQQKKHK